MYKLLCELFLGVAYAQVNSLITCKQILTVTFFRDYINLFWARKKFIDNKIFFACL